MTERLFPLLLALTLFDLAFVQATGAVGFTDMVPLWALAFAAPMLRRLQQRKLYRLAWNGAVLVVFTLLVHHATGGGLVHLLEDGLLLAVLCQVHLLNNIGARQRPDLIFFNSFLVAFITSFFAPDLTWSTLFVAHAFVLLPGLQLYALGRSGRELSVATCRQTLRNALLRTAVTGALTAIAFVLVPRDFNRTGWLGDALQLHDGGHSGVDEKVRIGDERPTRLGDDIVLELQVEGGDLAAAPTHWRTIAYDSFGSGTWSQQQAGRRATPPNEAPWQPNGGDGWHRDGGTAAPLLRVRLHDRAARRPPLPLHAVQLRLGDATNVTLQPNAFGGLAMLRRDTQTTWPLSYEVRVGTPAPLPVSRRVVDHFTTLPERSVPGVLRTLANELHRALPADASRLQRATAATEWLQNQRRYELPGGPAFARNLTEFLLGTGAGHCEYFATALALLLRAQNVPCRLAGGYLVAELEPERAMRIARSKHAHAWVEVLDEHGRWHTFDATPAADLQSALATPDDWWSRTRAELKRLWAGVTGFGNDDRRAWVTAVLQFPVRQPIAFASALAAVVALLYVRRRRRRGDPATDQLQRAARAAGVALLAGETPRELLVRAATVRTIAPQQLARLRAAALAHEAARYGATPPR